MALAKYRSRARGTGKKIQNVFQKLYSNPQENDMPNDSVAGIILSKAKPCKLHLDDAVSVLGNLTLT